MDCYWICSFSTETISETLITAESCFPPERETDASCTHTSAWAAKTEASEQGQPPDVTAWTRPHFDFDVLIDFNESYANCSNALSSFDRGSPEPITSRIARDCEEVLLTLLAQ